MDESVYSPICSPEYLMSTLFIDDMEQRDVAAFDLPEDYLQTDITEEKRILICIRDEFVDIMCEVNPAYKPYVQYDNGKKVLYVKVLREIYGCVESALLWYNFYIKTLQDLEFSTDKYGRCVSNKIIYGNQCTIVWYVD